MGRTPQGETRARVLEFVRERLLAGEPPTVREVQLAFGFRSVQTARHHLERLVVEGRLAVERGKARGYRLTGPGATGPAPLEVPLLGRVEAGGLAAAIEDPRGYVPVSARRGGELFALEVRGESMTGVGILPGDVVIVRRQPTARSGDVVVALVDDEATVKTLRLKPDGVELHPENPAFDPILPDREVTLLGKVVEVRRVIEVC